MSGLPETLPLAQVYGVAAEFDNVGVIVAAARDIGGSGFKTVEAYTPFPVAELTEAVGFREHRVPLSVLIGGVLGGLGGFALQYCTSVLDYPHNIGGRPMDSWQAFVPVTYESIILGALGFGYATFFFLNRLPRLSRPVFSARNFYRASSDRFFLCVVTNDSDQHPDRAEEILRKHAPLSLSRVPKEETW
jgi:hypothetical protein